MTAPASIAGDYPVGLPSFGPADHPRGGIGAGGRRGAGSRVRPPDEPSRDRGEDRVDRSRHLHLLVQGKQAQDAGAIGVIIVNNAAGPLPCMAPGAEGDLVTIPSLAVTHVVGTLSKPFLRKASRQLLRPVMQQRLNNVSASSDVADPVPANNTSSVSTTILRDSDWDLTSDAADPCPSDPLKGGPGFCGCGTRDFDTDGTGAIDCLYTNELAGRVEAATGSVGQLKIVGGRIEEPRRHEGADHGAAARNAAPI